MALSSHTSPQPLSRLGHVNACSAVGGTFYASGLGRMFFWGADEPAAADYPAPGSVWIDTDNAAVCWNAGTMASPSWSTAGTGSPTLDQAFDQGKVINGATTEANAFGVGGATDYFTFWQEGANDIRIGTTAGANITIVPEGGTVAITGSVTISTNLTVTGTIALDAVTAATTSATLALNGNGSGGVSIGATSTGGVTLGANTTVSSGKTLTMTGTEGSTIVTLTAGDMAISDGSLTITDDDNAASLTILNATITSGTLIQVTADALDAGIMLDLDSDGIGASTYYLRCYDGSAADLTIGQHGAIVITGNAATDVLTLTAGDLQITAGDIDLDLGFIAVNNTADESNIIERNYNGAGTSAVLQVVSTHASSTKETLFVDANGTGGSLAVLIDHEGTGDCVTITSKAAAASLIKATAEAATGTVLEVIGAASSTVAALSFANSGTGATGFLGATGVGIVTITSDGNLAHANASCLLITYSGTGAATGLGTSIRVVDSGATATSNAVFISAATGGALLIDGNGTVDTITVTSAAAAASALKITAEAATGTALELICAASTTTAVLTVDASSGAGFIGATGVGAVTITCDGNLAHANASCLLIAYSGTGAASGMGTSLRITDSGATATSWAAYVSAATGEALYVGVGKSHFVESISVLASPVFKSAPNFIVAGGGNNALTGALLDSTGTAVALTDGLLLLVDTGDYTLQAGANTFNLNAGGAVSIKLASNPATDIAAHTASSMLLLAYNATSTCWQLLGA